MSQTSYAEYEYHQEKGGDTLEQVAKLRVFHENIMGKPHGIVESVPHEFKARGFDQHVYWHADGSNRGSPKYQERPDLMELDNIPLSSYTYRRPARDGLPLLELELRDYGLEEQVLIRSIPEDLEFKFVSERGRKSTEDGRGSSNMRYRLLDSFLLERGDDKLRNRVLLNRELNKRGFAFNKIWRSSGLEKQESPTHYQDRPDLDDLHVNKPSEALYYRRQAGGKFHSFNLEYYQFSDGLWLLFVNTEPVHKDFHYATAERQKGNPIDELDNLLNRVDQVLLHE